LPTFSRAQIARNYERRRRGQISDADWAQLEPAMIAAGREGRVANPQPITKNRGWDGF
jgi:hypothetical protein